MNSPISRYYDRNTQRFIRFGAKGSADTIHRALWAPGVKTRNQAVHQVHELILSYAPDISKKSMVWDLGCGVGASMRYLSLQKKTAYRGITISEVQQQIAHQMLDQLLIDKKNMYPDSSELDIRILKGDFCDPEILASLLQEGKPDLVYMIESFVHGNCSEQLIEFLARFLQPGGRMILCDDFLASPEYLEDPIIQTFCKGWHIQTFITPQEFQSLAKKAGLRLVEDLNLSSWIEHNRPRDKIIRTLINLADTFGFSKSAIAQSPFWQNMYGGNALQLGTLSGKIQYQFLVFEKPC